MDEPVPEHAPGLGDGFGQQRAQEARHERTQYPAGDAKDKRGNDIDHRARKDAVQSRDHAQTGDRFLGEGIHGRQNQDKGQQVNMFQLEALSPGYVEVDESADNPQ